MTDIKEYEGLYRATRNGDIFSVRTNKFLKPGDNGKGYKYVFLWKDRKKKRFYVHRIIAGTFLENPNEYKYVDHILPDRSDNNMCNLQWISGPNNSRKALGSWSVFDIKQILIHKFIKGKTSKEIGNMLNRSHRSIEHIMYGTRYTDIVASIKEEIGV